MKNRGQGKNSYSFVPSQAELDEVSIDADFDELDPANWPQAHSEEHDYEEDLVLGRAA